MAYPTSMPCALPSTRRRTASCSLPSISSTSTARICGARSWSDGARLRKLIKPDRALRSSSAITLRATALRFFKAAAELGLEGIVSKRAASRYRSGPSRSWLKTKNMVESEFVLLGTDRDSDGVPWALLASDRDGRLEFAGPAI